MLESSAVSFTNYTYDALGRVIEVRNPDGTNKTVIFDHYNITTFDENGNKHVYVLDSFGRITSVYEYNNDPVLQDNTLYLYNTSYTYDVQDNLVQIEDAKGNLFMFFFDTLGRKVKMDDPDLGVWRDTYDSVGNLIEQADNRGISINLLLIETMMLLLL